MPQGYQSAFIFFFVIFFALAFISLAYGMVIGLQFLPAWLKAFLIGVTGLVTMIAFGIIALVISSGKGRRR